MLYISDGINHSLTYKPSGVLSFLSWATQKVKLCTLNLKY